MIELYCPTCGRFFCQIELCENILQIRLICYKCRQNVIFKKDELIMCVDTIKKNQAT